MTVSLVSSSPQNSRSFFGCPTRGRRSPTYFPARKSTPSYSFEQETDRDYQIVELIRFLISCKIYLFTKGNKRGNSNRSEVCCVCEASAHIFPLGGHSVFTLCEVNKRLTFYNPQTPISKFGMLQTHRQTLKTCYSRRFSLFVGETLKVKIFRKYCYSDEIF